MKKTENLTSLVASSRVRRRQMLFKMAQLALGRYLLVPEELTLNLHLVNYNLSNSRLSRSKLRILFLLKNYYIKT